MIRYVCDVEDCETTHEAAQSVMGPANAPPGWHEVVTATEVDPAELKGMPLPRQMARRKLIMMGMKRRLVCPNHPMPKWKEGSGEEDDGLLGIGSPLGELGPF